MFTGTSTSRSAPSLRAGFLVLAVAVGAAGLVDELGVLEA
jgi:hypothetical protein